MAAENYIGRKFGRLTVTANAQSRHGMRMVAVQCECANTSVVFLKNLKSGHTQSCGCKFIEAITAHGNSTRTTTSPTYVSWSKMRTRCLNANDEAFSNYGGRGIRICDRWLESFENFLADMGPRPAGTTLDRIEVDGPYDKSNCRWATKAVQVNNTRRSVYLEHEGQRLTLGEWAVKLGVSEKRIRYRHEHGWPTEKILSSAKFNRHMQEVPQ